MQRDMYVLRTLLLAVELEEVARLAEYEPTLKAHIPFAIEVGLLTGQEMGKGNYPAALLRLTAQGRDFMDLARNDAIWQRVAQRIAEKVETTSLPMWHGLLEAEHRKALTDGD